MTTEMIERARANAAAGAYDDVEFFQATIDRIPCSGQARYVREIARILKPGGRLAVSDIALKGELPEAIAQSLAAFVGCIAGAIHVGDYQRELTRAGLENVQIMDSSSDLNAYAKVENQAGCCSPAMDAASCCSPAREASTVHEDFAALLSSYEVNAAAASVRVYALTPAAT